MADLDLDEPAVHASSVRWRGHTNAWHMGHQGRRQAQRVPVGDEPASISAGFTRPPRSVTHSAG